MSTQLPYYSADDIRVALPVPQAIEVMRAAFAALHAGRVTMPVRLGMPTPKGLSLFMPAYIAAGEDTPTALGQKVVHVFTGNPARGLPTIHALVTLFDAETGVPRALLEGTYLTALRTAAVTGLATQLLANPDAHTLAVFGAGGQASLQIEAVCAVRDIRAVRIISRGESAGMLADRLQAADPGRTYRASNDTREETVRWADVIVTSTTSSMPLFGGSLVRAGTLVNAIGAFTPNVREVDSVLLNRATVVVDNRAAALHEAGDFLIPIAAGEWKAAQIAADLGELVSGACSVPYDGRRITFFKSNGLAVEDIAAASAVVSQAERK